MSISTNNLDIFLGKKLRAFRDKMNWPLKTVASVLGVSIQQVQRYEEGKNKISASMLHELAELYKTSILSFYEGFNVDQHLKNVTTTFNIILVEDNLQDDFIFRKSLEDFPTKLNITSINDGTKALSYFRSINEKEINQYPKPDLIILDLNLPDMKGFELLKELKRKALLRDIPVLIMTNSADNEDIDSSYKLQASGFIQKSFSYEEFKSNCFKTLDYWINTVQLPT